MCMLAAVFFQMIFKGNGPGYSVLGVYVGMTPLGANLQELFTWKVWQGMELRKESWQRKGQPLGETPIWKASDQVIGLGETLNLVMCQQHGNWGILGERRLQEQVLMAMHSTDSNTLGEIFYVVPPGTSTDIPWGTSGIPRAAELI